MTGMSPLLAVGAHPDDVELNVGGSILLAREKGHPVSVCHLTRGEMGTRGSVEVRTREAEEAARRLDAKDPIFLDLPDGRVTCDEDAKDRMIRVIRKIRPHLILAPYWTDLHPDHAATGEIVRQANFLAGLQRWETDQEPWRAAAVLHYMSHTPIAPSIIVDISEQFSRKRHAAEAYASQFFDPDSRERKTFIAGENFWNWWEARHRYWGHFQGIGHAEAFLIDGPIPMRDPFALFGGFGKYAN